MSRSAHSDPPRVVHLNLARGFRGGERQTELLVRELAQRGRGQILIARSGGELAARLADVVGLDLRTISWPYLPFTGAARGGDVLHAHEGKATTFAWLAARRFGVPYVITRRMEPPPSDSPLTRRVYRHATALVALSRGVRDSLVRWQARPDIRLIPSASSGLPVDAEEVARIRRRFAGRFLAVCAAALAPRQKGQDVLIEAARELATSAPDVTVLLLGRGPEEDELRAAAAGLDNVVFGGFVENLGDYLAAADLFVLPSKHEGLGSVLLDAFEAGLPVLTTRIPGVVDVVRDQHEGLLVPPGEPGALARALERLRQDPELRARLGRTARESARGYTAALMADRYAALYDEVTGRGADPDPESGGAGD